MQAGCLHYEDTYIIGVFDPMRSNGQARPTSMMGLAAPSLTFATNVFLRRRNAIPAIKSVTKAGVGPGIYARALWSSQQDIPGRYPRESVDIAMPVSIGAEWVLGAPAKILRQERIAVFIRGIRHPASAE